MSAAFDPKTINAEARTVEVIFSVSGKMWRSGWDGPYHEQLSLKESHVRLDFLRSGRAPVLGFHDRWGGHKSLLGVIEDAWIVSDDEARARLRLSKRASLEELWEDVQAGILCNVSPGYIVHRYLDISTADDPLPVLLAVDWEPREISFVDIPADPGARVASGRTLETFPVEVIRRSETQMDPEDELQPEGTTSTAAAGSPPAPAGGARTPAAPPAPVPNVAAAERAARESERQRIAAITALASQHGFGSDQRVQQLITSGASEDDSARQILEWRVQRYEATATHGQISVGTEEVTKVRTAATHALLHRCDPERYPIDKVAGAQDFAGESLLGLVQSLEERRGRRVRGRDSLVKAAQQTTSDFPHIVDNVANKRLLDAYEQEAKTHKAVAKVTQNSDFKPAARVRLGDAPRLKKVLESGEITRGSMGEGRESIRLATYARIVSLSRQLLIDDDLSAFDGLVTAMGERAAENEADLVWAIIQDNANMSDGVALFHTASHGNLISNVLNTAGLAAGRKAMRLQRGIGDGGDAGTRLNLRPRVLAVPPSLELAAEQLVKLSITPNETAQGNPFYGALDVVCEARLEDISPTCWFLFVAPQSSAHALEMAYLTGQMGPFFDRRDGFDVDGIELKIRHDVGVAAIDHRGVLKSTGAG